jgi:cytoskeletal protein CcmA (bactofilin family)
VFEPANEFDDSRRSHKSPQGGVTSQRLTTGFAVAATLAPAPVPERPLPLNQPASGDVKKHQSRVPVITGEAYYKGMMPVDGMLVGQITGNNGSLGVKQKAGSVFASQPELAGEIKFADMVRVNGHIAGTVYSKSGTLIIDSSATVDAHIDVAVAVIGGTVHGDIVAHQRIELGPCAKIYGNIWTRSLAVKDGAFFDGVCTMIDDRTSVV